MFTLLCKTSVPKYREALFHDSDTIDKLVELSTQTITKRRSHLVFVPYDQFAIQSPGHPDIKVITGFKDGKWIWDRPKPQDVARIKDLVKPAVLSLRTPPRGETTVEMQRERQFEMAGGRKSGPDKSTDVKVKEKEKEKEKEKSGDDHKQE